MMEVAVSPEALVHVYHSTHFLPGYKLLHWNRWENNWVADVCLLIGYYWNFISN
jgi:hypothetical protein